MGIKIKPFILSLLLIVVAFLQLIPLPVSAASNVQQVRTAPAFGIDKGTLTYSFTPSVVAYWDNWTPQANFSFGLPSFGAGTWTMSQPNSTRVSYAISASLGGGHFLSAFLNLDPLKGDQYSESITGGGTVTGLSGTISATWRMNGGSALSWNGGTSVCIRHLCFDFKDMLGLSASWNNSTKTLTFSVGPSFTIDPIALDVASSCTGNVAATSCNVGLTTTATNDILIVNEALGSTAPTDDKGNTYSKIISSQVWGWYSTWSGSGAITITCKGQGVTFDACSAFAIKGGDTTVVFDKNPSSKCNTALVSSVSSSSCNVSTYATNAILIGMIYCDAFGSTACPTSVTLGGGFSEVSHVRSGTSGCAANDCAGAYSESEVVSATQSNTAVGFSGLTNNANVEWQSMGFALCISGGCLNVLSLTFADTFTFSVANSRSIVIGRSFSDTFPFSDSPTRLVNLPRSFSDTFPFGDSPSRLLDLKRSFSDAFPFTDSPTRLIDVRRFLTDTFPFNPSYSVVCIPPCIIIPLDEPISFVWLLAIPLLMSVFLLMKRRR